MAYQQCCVFRLARELAPGYRVYFAVMNLAKITLVGIAHFVIGTCLYYQRIIHPSALFYSDELVFLAPLGLAFAGYLSIVLFCMFTKRHWTEKLQIAVLIAFVASAISFYCIMFFILNTWGS
jgi:hypothetical protein